MVDDAEAKVKVRPERRPRAWWQWVLGVGLLGAAVVLALIKVVGVRYRPDLFLKAVEPLEVRVSPDLEPKSVVPAERGEYAGCNLLLVTFDTTRADRIGCYGHEDIETPTLDGLAHEGVLFSQAVAPAPTTLPSHASILTGLYPYHHKARANGVFVLPGSTQTLAEVLADNGYATGAIVSAFVLDSQFGLDQGFDKYDDDLSEGQPRGWMDDLECRADQTTDRAIAWLDEHGEKRFFVWVHYFDPHADYQPPSPYDEQYKDIPYDGEIAFADAQLGRLLSAMDDRGLTDKTLVVMTSDHGEGLGEHGEWTHGHLLYEPTLRVPLIMRCGQRLGGGVHIERQVCLVDIMPTVLSLLGIDGPEATDGADLTQPGDPSRPVFVETLEGLHQWGLAPLHAVRVGGLKYIYGPDPELYDLGQDPHERDNLLASRAETAADLRLRLSAFYDDNLEHAAYVPPTASPGQVDVAKLAALGYVDGGLGDAPPPRPLPDPKTKMKVIERIQFALQEEDNHARISQLKKLADRHPDFLMVHRYLGDAYVAAGDATKARSEYERCLEIFPDAPYVLLALAQLATVRGELPEAEELCRRGLGRNPNRLNVKRFLGDMLAAQGKFEEAVDVFKDCFELRPSDRELVQKMVMAYSQINRLEEATELLRAQLEKQPRLAAVRITLSTLLSDAGEREEPVALLREGLELQPDNLDVVMTLALILAKSPNPDETPTQLIEASMLAEQVCEKTGYSNCGYLHGLAMVYYTQRRVDEAIAVLERALEICADTTQPGMTQLIRQTLEACQASKEAGVTPLTDVQDPAAEQWQKAAQPSPGPEADRPDEPE